MTKKTDIMSFKAFGLLLGLFLALNIGLGMLTTAIAYPTQGHKEVGAKLATLTNEAFTSSNFALTETAEYKTLNEHPDSQYSNLVNGIGTGVQLLAWLALVVFAYRYVKKRNLIEYPVLTVVVASGLASALTIIPMEWFMRTYAGIESIFTYTSPVMLVTAAASFVWGMLLTWLVVKIAEWFYNRKHGFVEA